MILTSKSKYSLREAKSQSKQKEYRIEKKDYPNYRTDTSDLDYICVYIMSKYVEAIIENDLETVDKLYCELKEVSQYFNSAINMDKTFDYNYDYMLSGACAYFLSDDFGSAKALIIQIKDIKALREVDKLLYAIIYSVFGKRFTIENLKFETSHYVALYKDFLAYLDTGDKSQKYLQAFLSFRNEIFNNLTIFETFYIDILYAILCKIFENSSWTLLPQMSKIDKDIWTTYLKKCHAMKMLWSAQKLIGEAGILAGKNGIIQLPTGVGKTKSLELIIRSAFFSARTNVAIVIAPLRALCNEISRDLHKAFYKEAEVNQFSDVLQEDYNFEIDETKKHIIVSTPEKLKYVIHHNKEFLDIIGLFVFDEGHMFDDLSRGASYELLITTIKSCMNFSKQFVLISAVLSNIIQMNEWLLDNDGAIISSENIKTTEKNIGFTSFNNKEINYFSDNNFEDRDYYIRNAIKVQKLNNQPRERTERLFPENNTKDIALYLLNKLSPNGASAIYVKQPNYVRSYIDRIVEIHNHGYNLDNIIETTNSDELNRLHNLICLHYGNTATYAQGALLGIFPHYAYLENGVKISIEFAIKNELINCVVCTSTLAQGVNIPIKYLFITSLDNYQRSLKARELQNLVGRTARAGMHTEGSVIITDPRLFESKNTYRGNEIWTQKIKLFNPHNSEPCGSAIHLLVENLILFYDYHLKRNYIITGKEILESILKKLSNANCYNTIISDLIRLYNNSQINEELKNKKRDSVMQTIILNIKTRKLVVESIENHISFY